MQLLRLRCPDRGFPPDRKESGPASLLPLGEQSLVAGVGVTEHALACSEAPLPNGLP